MGKGYYWIIGIVVVIALAFLFINLVVKDLFIISGPFPLAKLPTVSVEATFISLDFGDLEDEGECGFCPGDKGILRVDKIDRSDDPNNTINLEVGDEIQVRFKWSARPAKLLRDIPPYCAEGWIFDEWSCYPEGSVGPGTVVSSPMYEEVPAEFKDGFIIYHLPKNKNGKDVILPGLEEGSRIKISQMTGAGPGMKYSSINIGIYEIIV